MPLQQKVNLYPVEGVPGERASFNDVFYAGNLWAEGNVVIGTFVWGGTDPTKQAKNGGAWQPLGLVVRNLSYPDFDATSEGTQIIPNSFPLSIAKTGDFYVVALTASSFGQKVFAVLADGTLKTAAAGATVSGAVETPWTVTSGSAAIGELITVSKD